MRQFSNQVVLLFCLFLYEILTVNAQQATLPNVSSNQDLGNQPNILFILADDIGFTDIGPYGSEVNTPNLSELAEQGIRFSNYHTAANCAPSRAMLLTGVSNHLAGVPNIPEMIAPEQRRFENYQGVLGHNVVTVASLLENAGYHTYMAGKWHLGMTPEKLPSQRGFERTVAMADSGADNWEQRPYIPLYEEANWFADGKRHSLPEDFYSSTYLVDKTIEFIDSNRHDDKPFFAYLPFMAVHIPVQAPQEYIDRYMGSYDSGWNELKVERTKRARALGIIPSQASNVTVPSMDDWDELSEERRRFESKRMAVYAAMIESMDHEIGRLFAYLKETGEYDNTLIVFTSDNGAEGSGPTDATARLATIGPSRMGYSVEYDTLGLKGSYNSIGPNFASAAVSPLSYFKFYTGEGGMRVPLIISGPGVEQRNVITNSFAWATDITPTLLSEAKVSQPNGRFAGRLIEPISGKSLSPLLKGSNQPIRDKDESVGYELAGHAALFQGDYKIVVNQAPLGDGKWRLFNIVSDPGEANDLKGDMPDLFENMLKSYEEFKEKNKVAPVPKGYSTIKQLIINVLHKSANNFIILLLSILILLPFWVAWRMRQA